ncbi:hypothetical protein LR48_Vigan644s000100 [Vigna angularis]|uniref:Uncharacterized protein n=1 Tax=Phaseolus angularis TaxID=3914 RepID=A0A0L9TFG7_PHAAN|nr:hypothetical protein LR48_Vigan644s000100 [Vigna angularis]
MKCSSKEPLRQQCTKTHHITNWISAHQRLQQQSSQNAVVSLKFSCSVLIKWASNQQPIHCEISAPIKMWSQSIPMLAIAAFQQ